MRKNIKRAVIGIGMGIIILGTSLSFSEPGSDRDPLVTMSYVEKKIEQVKFYIDDKISNSSNSTSSSSFLVVEVGRGESLILGAGSEVILRSGQARAISRIENGIDNGLADVTSGKDTDMNEVIKANHLLLSSRDDGRGATVTRDAIFLVRGPYRIKK